MNLDSFSRPLVLSSMAILFVSGVALGYFFSPEYRMDRYGETNMRSFRADRFADLAYMNAMIAHHRGAMLLAEAAREKTTRVEIRSIAETILREEPKAIEELVRWKKEWYRDPRSVRDPEVPQLGEAGANFDLRFLNALLAHHQAGIEMTRAIRIRSSRGEILDNADSVEAFLRKSGGDLASLRETWYGISVPSSL
ncbi:MAG: DUF305 domain-containing protein [Candidatus Moraniibacteriota bacterium]|nr:MAG: DUF305 domain-containing protein [Candidatus Moranbacteria bacterium]